MGMSGTGVSGLATPWFLETPWAWAKPQCPEPHLSGEAQPCPEQGQVPGQAVLEVWGLESAVCEGSILPHGAWLSPGPTSLSRDTSSSPCEL